MIQKVIQKKLITICLLAVLILSLLPLVSSTEQKKDEITIMVQDNTTGSLETHEITLSHEVAKHLILELMKNDINPANFKQEMNKKLVLLTDTGLISADTADTISNNFNKKPKIFFRTSPVSKQGILFDMSNIFSGTFFGMEGVTDFTYLDLTMYQFPFFSGDINAGFYGWSRFTGKGTVFSVGFLGFKYLYDFNETKYDFPYFPEIRGSVFGYTGLLIYLESLNISGTEEGPYIIGIGMSIATVWNNHQTSTVSKNT